MSENAQAVTDKPEIKNNADKFVDMNLVITLRQFGDGRGQVLVAGPTANKLLCAHMIADALKAILEMPNLSILKPKGHT
jgi:hypothetical protein